MPDNENGRYTLVPKGDEFVRLDTRTGQVSMCGWRGAGWACLAMPDDRAALDAEIGRLVAENERLKRDLAGREEKAPRPGADIGTKADPQEKTPPDAKNKDPNKDLRLPDDADIDRAVAFIERAWRKLVDMVQRLQRDVERRI